MKGLLYISHPYIDEIDANIKKKKYNSSYTELVLDRYIFMPKTSYLLDENPKISSSKLIDCKFVDDQLVLTIEGNIKNERVTLKIDRKIRLRNLYYNSAFYIFKAIFHKFYNISNLSLFIGRNKAQIKVNNFYEDFDLYDFKLLFNKLIKLGLDINVNLKEVFIDGFETFPSEGVYLKNTKSLEGIYVFFVEQIDDKLLIEFVVGDDYLNFIDNSINLLEAIKNIAIEDLDANEKIRKIISTLQNQPF